MSVSAYLHFNGDCAEACRHYVERLGAEIVYSATFGEAPEDVGVAPEWRDKIMHANLRIGGSTVLVCDSPPAHQEPMSGFSLTFATDDDAEAERVFDALADGGRVIMPLAGTFWARRFGMAFDRFGVRWMVNCGEK